MAKIFQKHPLAMACGLIISSFSGQINASGFAIIEQSASGMGNAFANTAEAADASTVFFNPAGMSRLSGTQVTSALHYISPGADYSDKGSSVNPALTASLTGNSTTSVPNSLKGDGTLDAGLSAVVPNLYFVSEITDKINFGLGINAPFGLATEYDDGWVGRYHALRSEVKTLNINPSLSFKINQMVSFGFGLNAQYEETTLSNAVDFGTVCVGSIEPRAGAGTCAAIGVNPLQSDGKANIEVASWGFGYNLGVMFNISESARIGLAYRSKIEHDARGDADFRLPANFAAFLNGAGIPLFRDTGASATITLPETASINGYFAINKQLSVMADYTWTAWSRFESLDIKFDSPIQPSTHQPENWNDTYRISGAVNYRPMNALVLRLGIAYDQSPVPNKLDRTPRIPDEDRRWLTLGLGYQLSKTMTLDFGYAHLFVNDVDVDAVDTSTKHRLVGDYSSDVNILSGQVSIKF